MTDLFLSGPDALGLLERLAVNSFATFTPGKAKQYVAVNPDGFIIGDAILFHLPDGSFDLVGHPMVLDWVEFHAEARAWTRARVRRELDRPHLRPAEAVPLRAPGTDRRGDRGGA